MASRRLIVSVSTVGQNNAVRSIMTVVLAISIFAATLNRAMLPLDRRLHMRL